jgi:hypothetical protein
MVSSLGVRGNTFLARGICRMALALLLRITSEAIAEKNTHTIHEMSGLGFLIGCLL